MHGHLDVSYYLLQKIMECTQETSNGNNQYDDAFHCGRISDTDFISFDIKIQLNPK